ncbi:tRNA (uridine(54)-C5)-methyltransferase TrmA [Gilvimarinus sp. SDUM040013]|uniref:tRNA/tmRNA (uracil-C(5))-methyltransferase n=1 Tax=Gilvimarinus gilvus TaxID=3058038 RepID=A0ABU4S2U7_9GAMM|nr:tRNA (uridine(54)-C5)-methyltransferase TrmA [Gilvimarinus sp. SDUM040013]MDO3384981.1 tRNA (uridine(54)-C5)-methyltransferase TrmA [Gilvimarinus sp. SDUM040013]MDX6851502.1 tRNA (uridine(54)-C5)-methyltransferase TrmA [Gilvimarinus sp. SDUM040013]
MTIVPFSEESYTEQLSQKLDTVNALFQGIAIPKPELFKSPPAGYRMRAEFKIWHEGSTAAYAMYKKGEYKKPYTVTTFEPGHVLIQDLMPRLLECINQSELLRKRLFQVEFLTTLSGEALITLIYHKKLDEQWQALATSIAAKLNAHIIGRSRKQKMIIGSDFVTEKLNVGGRDFVYQQIEGSFTQPNAHICEKMLTWATHKCENFNGDLLELYCGNGNFTLPLSFYFNRVLATEISKVSVNSAKYNMEINGINNIDVVRMSSEEFSQAKDGVRPFRRLKDIDLAGYHFSTIFVDPPRAGLDEHTTTIATQHDNIIYISCNPATMARDVRAMSRTHKVTNFALFDQFPYTDHIECGAVLSRI